MLPADCDPQFRTNGCDTRITLLFRYTTPAMKKCGCNKNLESQRQYQMIGQAYRNGTLNLFPEDNEQGAALNLQLAVQPKKVRGLSLLQKCIVMVAAKGWITPHEACSCVEELGEYSDNWEATSPATVSRALRRLVQRGLLNRVPSEYRGQSDVYRLTNWQGTIPWIYSQHSRIGCILRNTGGVIGWNQSPRGFTPIRVVRSGAAETVRHIFNQSVNGSWHK